MSITRNGATYVFATQAIVQLPITALQDIPTDSLIGRDDVGTGSPEIIFPAGGIGLTGAHTLELTPNNRLRSLFFTIAGAPISTGIKQDYISPFACVINKVSLLADQTGSIVVDIWKTAFAAYPPTVTNTITGGNPPTIVTATKGQLTTLTGWTTSILAGDCLRFNVNSVTALTRVAVCLEVNTV
jgi:hypothetical protein